MTDKPGIRWPAWIIILDVAGTLCLALGLYGLFGGGNPFSPFAIPMIILGGLLMLPLIVYTVTRATSARR